MAKVRFIGDRPMLVPELGNRLLEPDEICTVPDERFDAYMLHPERWQSVEEPPAPEPAPAAPKRAAAKAAARKTTTTAAAAAADQAADTAAASTPAGAES